MHIKKTSLNSIEWSMVSNAALRSISTSMAAPLLSRADRFVVLHLN